MKLRDGAVTALLLSGVLLLAACAPAQEPASGGKSTPSASTSTASTSPDDPTPSGSPSPSATPTAKPVTLPTDCKAILSSAVLTQLKDIPLNDAAFGDSGVLKDGSLQCIWGSPQADTTGLTTTIERMPRGQALDMLNDLADKEGFTCFTPDGGTRCEKTWQNETYPITDGRTLFWRDSVLIDTRYSNLAPKGYTSSIITSIWG